MTRTFPEMENTWNEALDGIGKRREKEKATEGKKVGGPLRRLREERIFAFTPHGHCPECFLNRNTRGVEMFFSSPKMFRWASIILLHPIPIWEFSKFWDYFSRRRERKILGKKKQPKMGCGSKKNFCGSNNTVKIGEGYYIVFHPRDYEEDAFAA